MRRLDDTEPGMNNRHRPRPRDIELVRMPSIASQMPVKFENGNVWHTFEGCCASCGREIPGDMVRGTVTRQLTSCFTIEAVGVCITCRVGTPFLVRMHDNGSITTLIGGAWRRLEGKRPGLFPWLGGFWRRLMKH